MALFVDVETSTEAIQEDEEIIEAVEALVESAAISIYSDIMNDVQNFMNQTKTLIYTWFPLLLDYQQDESLWREDLKKLGIFAVLFVISFFILTPMNHNKHQRQTKTVKRTLSRSWLEVFFDPLLSAFSSACTAEGGTRDTDYNNNQYAIYNANSSISSNNSVPISSKKLYPSEVFVMEEDKETDEERFEKNWQYIRMSEYRRLVLPPICKLVEKPKRIPSKQQQQLLKQQQQQQQNEKDTPKRRNSSRRRQSAANFSNNDDDNPLNRLKHYLSQFLNLISSLFSYDYVGAGLTIINWFHSCFRIRRSSSYVNQANTQEDDEDDDDASSRLSVSASVSTNVSSTMVNGGGGPSVATTTTANTTIPLTPVRHVLERGVSFDSLVVEEKKESPRLVSESPIHLPPIVKLNADSRKVSDASVYETPMTDDFGEPDVGEREEVYHNVPQTVFSIRQQQQQQPQRPPHWTPAPGKRKDALESYRTNTSKIHFPITPKPTLPLPPADSFIPSTPADSSTFLPVPPDDLRSTGPVDSGGYFFEAAASQETIHQMTLAAPFPDKNGYILGDEFLPDSRHTPLLVFVNSRSGPQQGHLLITQLRRLLNPIQVWDLAYGGPEVVLESFCAFTRLRILVCGGDGTVSWIISTLEKMRLSRKWPPIAILPLGTGNDLARIHGWGGGYNSESLIDILRKIADSYISLLDRWEISIENKKGKVKDVKSFFNYLGVGADAQAALQVHMLRESKPELFFSRVVNKAWYGVFGAEDLIKATSVNLPREITLIADGVEIPLPPDSQGIILLNIDSYAGGVPMWAHGSKATNTSGAFYDDTGRWPRSRMCRSKSMGAIRNTRGRKTMMHDSMMERIDSMEDLLSRAHLSEEEKYERVTACDLPSSCQDGLLDVVSIRGAFHLGQIRVGLSNAQRLCQCREVKIIIKKKVAVQIDGEPWRQNVCTIHVKRKNDSAIMLHRSPDESGGVETEMAKLLDWAEERRLINGEVHSALMKEFSRRIESKNRQRRVSQTQDNLMFSLKRAIGSTGALSSSFDEADRTFLYQ